MEVTSISVPSKQLTHNGPGGHPGRREVRDVKVWLSGTAISCSLKGMNKLRGRYIRPSVNQKSTKCSACHVQVYRDDWARTACRCLPNHHRTSHRHLRHVNTKSLYSASLPCPSVENGEPRWVTPWKFSLNIHSRVFTRAKTRKQRCPLTEEWATNVASPHNGSHSAKDTPSWHVLCVDEP